jgi:RNA polymerase sigma-70 factor (sigma-E family)
VGIFALGPDFDVFVRDASPQLLRLAVRLTGDAQLAEDLVQLALWRVARRWHRARDNPAAYARTTLLNLSTDHWRARAVRVREVSGVVPDVPSHDEQPGFGDEALLAAIRKLPPRQRAVVVLRYWEDLSVEETATAMGCTTGTVKSTASKALAHLRRHLEPTEARP